MRSINEKIVSETKKNRMIFLSDLAILCLLPKTLLDSNKLIITGSKSGLIIRFKKFAHYLPIKRKLKPL